MNLVFVRYFDEMYVVSPLVVLCEHRLHDTSPLFGPRRRHWEVISRLWVARVTKALTLVYVLLRKGLIWIHMFHAMVRFTLILLL